MKVNHIVSTEGLALTKRFIRDGAGFTESSDKSAAQFREHYSRAVQFDGLSELADFLRVTRTQKTHALMLGKIGPNGHGYDLKMPDYVFLGERSRAYVDAPTRLMVIDIDGIPGDIEDAPDVLRDTIYASELMDGCGMVGMFSPSAMLKNDEIRARIFVRLSAPLSLMAQKRLAQSINVQIKEATKIDGVLDLAIYTKGRIIYTHPGIVDEFDGSQTYAQLPAQLPSVWHIEGGDVEGAIPASLHIRPADVGAGVRHNAGVSLEDPFGLVGANKGGFHPQITAGIMSIVRREIASGRKPDVAAIHAQVVAAVDGADQTGRSTEYIARIRDMNTTATSIDGAVRRFERDHGQHMDKAHTIGVTTRPLPVVTNLTPREQLLEDMKHATRSVERQHIPGNHFVFSGAPGTGKTSAAIEALDIGHVANGFVKIYTPTHVLGDEIYQKVLSHVARLATQTPTPGYNYARHVRQHKGRTQPGMCTDDAYGKLATNAELVGISPKKSVCPRCPQHNTCRWIAQDSDLDAGIVVTTHSELVTKPKDDWTKLAIIDESVFGTLVVSSDDIDPDTLHWEHKSHYLSGRPKQVYDKDHKQARSELIEVLKSELVEPDKTPARIGCSISLGALVDWEALEVDYQKKAQKRAESNFNSDCSALAAAIAVSKRAVRIIRALADSVRNQHALTKCIRVSKSKTTFKVSHSYRESLPAHIKDKGAIWLDGTVNLNVWERMVEPASFEVKHVELPVANVTVRQFAERTHAKASYLFVKPVTEEQLGEFAYLSTQEGAALKAAWRGVAGDIESTTNRIVASAKVAHAQAELANIGHKANTMLNLSSMRASIDAAASKHKKVLVVAQKAVALEMGVLPANVATATYGSLRGLNAYSDVDYAFVIGRPAPSSVAIEQLADTLTKPAEPPVAIATKYTAGKTIIQMTSGQDMEVKCEAHPDALCRDVQTTITQAEVQQAVARVRPYSRTTPVHIEVHGQHSSGLKVDHLDA